MLRNAVLFLFAVGLACASNSNAGVSSVPQKIPAESWQRAASGAPVEVLVVFEANVIHAQAAQQRLQNSARFDGASIVAFKAKNYAVLKNKVLATFTKANLEIARDYSHLPIALLRVHNPSALNTLAQRVEVAALYSDTPIFMDLAQSLPLIAQPTTAAAGRTGTGTTVAVLDTGLNYTLADFGSCTSPGVPAGCKVAAAVEIATDDGALDADDHGTHVAAVAVAVAPGARVACLDIFVSAGSSDSLVISGINWAIQNQATYNIVALNMSLGNGVKYTMPCASSATNPFVVLVQQTRAAGIVPVAASGNSTFIDGISRPACTPGVVSVGAVYDTNVGAISWTGLCTETGTTVDKVACFSNSANFLTLLAPGALITAAGSTKGSTSAASPHVAGAVAVLRAACCVLRAACGVRGRNSGADRRTACQQRHLGGRCTQRPGAAQAPACEGGASVWVVWTAPTSGLLTLDTHGSPFDTLLAVYTGSGVQQLTLIAANDNDAPGGVSGMSFEVQAGTPYYIVVDGLNGVTGAVTLNWLLGNLPANTEIPMLPPWGVLALGGALLWGVVQSGRSRMS